MSDKINMKNRLSILIFGLALLLYGNTLFNGYVLDDADLILKNEQVKKGVSSIGDIFTSKLRDGSGALKNELYRPITKLVYAIEWTIAENNPMVAHFFNVVLFALLCVFVFLVAGILFEGNLSLGFLTALLFIVHPVHTEVVDNIKSVDEILALLFFITSLLFLFKYLQLKKTVYLISSLLLYALSLFSKESSVSFIVLIPIFIYYAGKYKTGELLKTSFYFLLPLIVFILIRNNIMGDYNHSKMIGKIDNFLIAAHSPSQKMASCIYMLGYYIKLLFIPYPLVCDYSYNQFPLVTFTNFYVLFVTALLIYMFVFLVKNFKTKKIISISIVWFIVTIGIASNIFYLIGTNFAERLLFAPSLGFCFFLVWLLPRINNPQFNNKITFRNLVTENKLKVVAAGLILIIFAGITFNRNFDWKNNLTLIKKDVKKNEHSARLHFFLASELRNEIVTSGNSLPVQKRNLPEIKIQLEEALKIYPEYGSARFALGEYFMHVDSTRKALEQFNYSLYYLPKSVKVYNAIGMCMLNLKQYDSTILFVKRGLNYNPKNPDLIAKYGCALLNKNKTDSAIYFLQQSVAINPKNVWALQQLAIAYDLKKDTVKSNYYKRLVSQKEI